MPRTACLLCSLLALVPAGLAGCRSTPRQADPALARETLCRALDAWQQGAALEDFQKSSPTVTVVEPRWQKRLRLVTYEVKGDGEPSGFDHQFSVQLSLEDRGKKLQKKTTFNVSTSPTLVIVCSDDAG